MGGAGMVTPRVHLVSNGPVGAALEQVLNLLPIRVQPHLGQKLPDVLKELTKEDAWPRGECLLYDLSGVQPGEVCRKSILKTVLLVRCASNWQGMLILLVPREDLAWARGQRVFKIYPHEHVVLDAMHLLPALATSLGRPGSFSGPRLSILNEVLKPSVRFRRLREDYGRLVVLFKKHREAELKREWVKVCNRILALEGGWLSALPHAIFSDLRRTKALLKDNDRRVRAGGLVKRLDPAVKVFRNYGVWGED